MGSKTKESPPNEQELEKALPGLAYVGVQCAIWHLANQAITVLNTADPQIEKDLKNSLVESALLFIRKTVEFFKPEGENDYPDNVYAYRYRFCCDVGSLQIASSELHKRVGHVTISEVRYGKLDWPLDDWVLLCLDKWIEFFGAASMAIATDKPELAELCRLNVKRLTDVRALVQDQISR